MKKIEKMYIEMMKKYNITEEEIEEFIEGYPILDEGDEFKGVEQGSDKYDKLLYEAAIVRIATER